MRAIRNVNDVLAGMFLVAVGLVGIVASRPLAAGTAAAMGPGYFPTALASLLILFGTATAAYGFVGESRSLESWSIRPLFWVLVSILFFSLTVRRFGLLAATLGLVLLSCLASRESRPVETVVLAVGMAVFTVLIFVVALGLPLQILPAWLVR